MRGLNASQLLTVWEQGERRHAIDRALLMLSAGAAEDEASAWEALADLPIGERNRRLLALRAATFGSAMAMTATCPDCHEALEFSVDSEALVNAAPPAPAPAPRLTGDGYDIGYRLPSSRDLAAVATAAASSTGADPASLRLLLAQRCVLDADPAPGDSAPFGDDAVDALSGALAAADPLADIVFVMACPKCAAQSQQPLDVAAFLWAELVAQARHLLVQVDVLARVYHWSEADILALDPRRRQAYIERALA